MASSPKIIDAYSVFKPFDYLKIQAGQFKIPFSLENLTTSSNLETIERAQVVEALVARGKDVIGNNNGRDIGIQIFGSTLKIHNGYLVDYFAGVFNGAGINTIETNEIKDFVGRLLLHPLSGLCIGGSCYIGYDKIGTSNQVRNRYGCELSYDYKIISIKGEYITGQDGNIKRSGYYAQASCFVLPKKVQLVTRYDVFDNDVKTEKDLTTNVLSGLNFFFNDWAKIQVNCTLRYEEGTTINNDIIGAQLQVSF